MRKPAKAFSDVLRQAVLASDESQYRICKTIGLDPAVLCRFLQGKSGLSVVTIDALVDHLGLVVKTGPKRKPSTQQPKG
jgi:hypothetical protein